jgi:4-cresol dehydrogenase (hydroxylating)
MKNIFRAFKKWEDILGKKNVICDKKILKETQTTTFQTSQKILAIIKPHNREEVQECMRVANEYKIAIYPVSTGKNWGYGSSVPAGNNNVVMKLEGLNKISDYNEKLAYVTIGPGVTFTQLDRFLSKKKSNLTISSIGGSSNSSLIGNFVERGIGKGIYGNKYENACDLEIVLPTGGYIYTGFSNFSSAKISPISREMIGPETTGIFTQSNFGIVTKMTLWLFPKPKFSRVLTFHLEKDIDLKKVIDALRILKLEKTIQGNFLIANELRVLSNFQQYPWDETDGKTPLSKSVIEKLKKKWGIKGAWIGQIVLGASTKTELDGQGERIKTLLGKITKIIYFVDLKESFYKPTDFAVKSMYWRKKNPIPKKMDPDRDMCGNIWISPITAFEGKNLYEVVDILSKTMLEHGFEANIGINGITDRKLHVTGAIIYDRSIKGEDEKAFACHDKILESLLKRGHFPYRLNTYSMKKLPKPLSEYSKFLKTIKRAIDPNNILAPGRYDLGD